MNGTRDFLFRYPRRSHEKRKSNEAGSDVSSGFSPLSASRLRRAAANHVPKTEGSRVRPGCRTRPGCHTVILSARGPRSHPSLPFPVRSASRPGKTRYAADFPHRHGNPPAVPQQQRFTVLPAGPVSLSSRQVSTRAYRPIRGYRRRSPDSTVSLLSNRCRDMSFSTPPRYS